MGRKVKEYFSCAGRAREYLATLKSCYQYAGILETAGLTDRYAPIRKKNMGGQLLRCSVSANESCLTTPIVPIFWGVLWRDYCVNLLHSFDFLLALFSG